MLFILENGNFTDSYRYNFAEAKTMIQENTSVVGKKIVLEKISVFDIFKICIGPSSSHTMGPWVAATTFINSIEIAEINSIQVKLFGSLSKTGKGHGTDIAVMMGLSGYDFKTIDVHKVTDYVVEIQNNSILKLNENYSIPFKPDLNIEFLNERLPQHANALTFIAELSNGEIIEETFYSIGGGFILQEGKDLTPKEQVEFPYPIQSEKDLLDHISKTGMNISDVVLQNELAIRNLSSIKKEIGDIWNVMLECIYKGCQTPGTLPGGLNVKRRAADINALLLKDEVSSNMQEWMQLIKKSDQSFTNIIKWVSCFALAVNEENASFGRIVTAPTNGAAGVIPAVLMYYLCFCENKGDEDIQKFLMTAAEMGCLFKKGATISAAMGGCQAEIGVSSAMAAGALTERMGGTPKQVLMATEIAMEHHLGLTCDPIMGLVQVPCIERNTMGAIKAITASQIALSSDPEMAKVSLDGIIKTMKETAMDMNDKYKETSEGGLAIHVSVNVPEC